MTTTTPGELLTLADDLRELPDCVEHGLELDRDMTFSVRGNGPGSSTVFSIDRNIFWKAQKAIRRLAAKPGDEGRITDEMVDHGARGIATFLSDGDGGPLFDDLSEKNKSNARDTARACLKAALSTTGEPKR